MKGNLEVPFIALESRENQFNSVLNAIWQFQPQHMDGFNK